MTEQNKILKEEKQIIQEEKEILKEIKKEKNLLLGVEKKILAVVILAALITVCTIGSLIYLQAARGRIYIEDSKITAPRIDLSANLSGGKLEEIMVNEGDSVSADTIVARIGNELIKTNTDGIIVAVNKNIGKWFNRGEVVVSMIHPDDLRVIGKLQEDKGFKNITVGQPAIFTVDAFGTKKYFGTIDEISPISNESGVIFNISDKREKQEFNIKARFNINEYAELKSGMSAKMWIYIQ